MIIQPNDTSILKWNKNFGREKSEKFIRAQKFVDSECLRLMVPYTPTLNTGLRKSATTSAIVTGKQIGRAHV